MQIKERIVLQHSNGLYLNRRADGYVKEPDTALRFTDTADASQWLLNAPIAPIDTENYKYITIEIITRLKGVENDE
jgi:hypothetical protein